MGVGGSSPSRTTMNKRDTKSGCSGRIVRLANGTERPVALMNELDTDDPLPDEDEFKNPLLVFNPLLFSAATIFSGVSTVDMISYRRTRKHRSERRRSRFLLLK